jgi:hypothetical protein
MGWPRCTWFRQAWDIHGIAHVARTASDSNRRATGGSVRSGIRGGPRRQAKRWSVRHRGICAIHALVMHPPPASGTAAAPPLGGMGLLLQQRPMGPGQRDRRCARAHAPFGLRSCPLRCRRVLGDAIGVAAMHRAGVPRQPSGPLVDAMAPVGRSELSDRVHVCLHRLKLARPGLSCRRPWMPGARTRNGCRAGIDQRPGRNHALRTPFRWVGLRRLVTNRTSAAAPAPSAGTGP